MMLGLLAGAAVEAQNPIISGQFTADPTARVFDGKLYLYPSHDIPSPIERLKEWFCMADYHVFSSENLVDWKDHGVILSQEDVPWGDSQSYSMWAPDCVYKDGKYYFYFPASPKGGKGFNVGVATADKPYGPFVPLAEPIKGVFGIDPCVLLDKDDENSLIPSIDPEYFEKLKADGTVADGMLPKLENAFKAIAAGVGKVTIKNSCNIANDRQTVLLGK